MDVFNIYALGSIGSGKHLFFDTLNINFRAQEGLYKVYSNDYSYKSQQYKYIIYLISGSFKDPGLLPSQKTMCDAVIFFANPLIEEEFEQINSIIFRVSEVHPNALIVLVTQNVFGNFDSLPPDIQEVAMMNGAALCDLEENYNLKLCALNYNLDEIQSLENGDPMVQFKFFKLFNDTFYDIIHDLIERHENEDLLRPIRTEEL
ncbi:MAG: hypothetical protein EU544_01050 [Promethearchaeota archaeon]|nr:MAG: hypothetical protein EU544_01050 [Candidatus Lokiarchaeota archaeon]